MDKLTAYINSNRQTFDSEEPSANHADRFFGKLQQKRGIRKINTTLVASAAAIVGLIVTAGLSLVLNYGQIVGELNRGIVENSYTMEMQKIEEYYSNQLFQRKQQINNLVPIGKESLKQEALAVFSDVEMGYSNLRSEMVNFAEPERAAYVLPLFYQTQIEVLDEIIVKLEAIKQ
jgi:hypothetical protein